MRRAALVVLVLLVAGCGADDSPTAATTTASEMAPNTGAEVQQATTVFLDVASTFATDMEGCARIAESGDLAGLASCSRDAYAPVGPARDTAQRTLTGLQDDADAGCGGALGEASDAIGRIAALLERMAKAGRSVDAQELRASIDTFPTRFDEAGRPLLAVVEACV